MLYRQKTANVKCKKGYGIGILNKPRNSTVVREHKELDPQGPIYVGQQRQWQVWEKLLSSRLITSPNSSTTLVHCWTTFPNLLCDQLGSCDLVQPIKHEYKCFMLFPSLTYKNLLYNSSCTFPKIDLEATCGSSLSYKMKETFVTNSL